MRVQTSKSKYSLRRVVRRRSAALGVLIVCGIAFARHPETATRLRAFTGRGGATGGGPSLEALVAELEAADAAGQPADVARVCERICTRYPDHPLSEPAALRLIQLRVAARDYSGAQRAFDAFRALHPESALLPEALLDMAEWQYQVGDWEQAARTYTDLVAVVTDARPADESAEDTAPEPVIWRSQKLWKEHRRRERGRTEMERLARFNQALCFERGGSRDAALRAFERFRARFPQDERSAEAAFHEAALQLDAGRHEAALERFRCVYEDAAAPVALRSESIYRAGLLEQELRRAEAAIATFRRAQPIAPAGDPFRVASLAALAQALEEREPLRALDLYREIAECTAQPGLRAVALERLSALERDSAVAAAGR